MKKMLKIFLIVFVITVLSVYGYFVYLGYLFTAPTINDEIITRPDLKTPKERRFCDSLNQNGYHDVKIYKQIDYNTEKKKVDVIYKFYYKREPAFNENQADSINLENIRLLTTLLSKYVSDRMLYENKRFYIAYEDLPNSSYLSINNNTLEKLCGFKLVKTVKYKYKRIFTRPKGSEPKLFIPYTWIRNDGKYS